MDASQIIVTAGGIALIGLTLWYFFGEKRAVQATGDAGGVQAVRIEVRGGYDPAVIAVERGRPVRLEFHRNETASCSEQLLIPDFGIARDLPAHKVTPVELTPGRVGEFPFTCGMNMLRGKLVVKERLGDVDVAKYHAPA